MASRPWCGARLSGARYIDDDYEGYAYINNIDIPGSG